MGFRDRIPEFTDANAEILGISFDVPADNKAFAEKCGFPFRLLSDIERSVGDAYGAKRGPDEKFPDVPKRITYVIDPEGQIAKTYEVTDVEAHPAEVLSDLRELQAAAR